MEKKLIVRIAEGLGNQLFMYAHAYSLSKLINYKLYIDDESGFIKTKEFRNYYLNNFKVSAEIINDDLKFNNFNKNLKRKILKKTEFFRSRKKFILEKKYMNKTTKYERIEPKALNNIVYVEGHYESEKYFLKFKSELIDEFKFKNNLDLSENYYFDIIKKNKNNIISICIRTNRFSERPGNQYNIYSKNRSDQFVKDTIDYIYRAIDFLKNKIQNPIYLIWSNDFSNLKEYFPNENFIFVDNKVEKIITDFSLLNECRNFIVGPTSFHWWGAWLNNENNKICIRPSNINPSKNKDFWPSNWIEI
ncbi:alpha-1,2-fucosyltransferase [Candidatus Pelagibacter sp.]|uniref:alpha-1,2-fucosyltransferase n=1 Tax=Candidatus Pelagibacter sp. TaxID=2024849 RepID=UPI003F85E3E7